MISVVILNYKNPPLLRLALSSLARAHTTTDALEVIVVDSSSTAETQNVVLHDCADLFDRLILVPFTHNTGYTNGVNEGLRRATGEYLLVLNPDVVVLPGAIDGMVAYLRDHPNVGLIGPGLLNFDDTRQDSCFSFYTPLTMLARRVPLPFMRRKMDTFLLRGLDLTRPQPVDWVMGSALMTTRSALEQVGLMDERFFLYLSEVDWAHRFWENGYSVTYLPTVRMYHYHQRQSKGSLGLFDVFVRQETRWHVKDAIRYFRKHGVAGLRPWKTQPLQPNLLSA